MTSLARRVACRVLPSWAFDRLIAVRARQVERRQSERNRIMTRGSAKERLTYFNAAKRTHARSLETRKRLAKGLSGVITEMPPDEGFSIAAPAGMSVLDEALAEARETMGQYRPGTNKRAYDSLEGVRRRKLDPGSAINRLAMHPHVVASVSRYLGFLPILYRINLLFSPNDAEVESSSQYFHLDPEDWKQVKIFIHVEDVDQDTGPFVLLPADKSALVRQRAGYRGDRISDEAMFSIVSRNDPVVCTGRAGTMIFVDTSQCFHMGSRRGAKPRYVIMLQYLSPFAIALPGFGPVGPTPLTKLAIPERPNELERYLLGVDR